MPTLSSETLTRAFWILLAPCFCGGAACESASSAPSVGGGGSAGSLAGSANEAGVANGESGAPTVGGQEPSAGAGSGGGATADAGATCGETPSPNHWASWPISDPTVTTGALAQRFTLTGDTATDAVTQLVWQRHAPAQTFTWQEAARYCACLSLDGQADWQLPSRMELVSIVDYTKQDPALNELAFPDTPFEWFWTASPVAATAGDTRYWYVAFWDGNTHASSPDQDYRLRCVRKAAGQTPRYDLSVEGTAKDASTGLTWQRAASAERVTWAAAGQLCGALSLAGGGWRLPSMSELQSLVDETEAAPAIDGSAFPATPSEGFWAGTPLAGDATAAWFVTFLDGVAYNALLEHPNLVRCVR